MASIRKRGNSYLIVVSMGYDYNGKRIKPQQKTVHPPAELTPRQVEKWLNEQAVLFERDCRHTPQPVQQLTLAKYIDLWLTDIAPGKLAKSTIRRDRQDIERILPALGPVSYTHLDVYKRQVGSGSSRSAAISRCFRPVTAWSSTTRRSSSVRLQFPSLLQTHH